MKRKRAPSSPLRHDEPGFARCPHDRRQDRGAAGRQGDRDAIREELTKADVEAVIPAKSNRREPIAQPRKISLAQPRRAPVQQAQELAAHRNTIRQNQGILPRLCQSRVSPAVDTLCPRNLNLSDDFNRFSENSSKMAE
jgi:hypothetical protein